MKRTKSKNKNINYPKEDDSLDIDSNNWQNNKKVKNKRIKKRKWNEYLKNEKVIDTINLKVKKIILIVMIIY